MANNRLMAHKIAAAIVLLIPCLLILANLGGTSASAIAHGTSPAAISPAISMPKCAHLVVMRNGERDVMPWAIEFYAKLDGQKLAEHYAKIDAQKLAEHYGKLDERELEQFYAMLNENELTQFHAKRAEKKLAEFFAERNKQLAEYFGAQHGHKIAHSSCWARPHRANNQPTTMQSGEDDWPEEKLVLTVHLEKCPFLAHGWPNVDVEMEVEYRALDNFEEQYARGLITEFHREYQKSIVPISAQPNHAELMHALRNGTAQFVVDVQRKTIAMGTVANWVGNLDKLTCNDEEEEEDGHIHVDEDSNDDHDTTDMDDSGNDEH